MRWRTAVRPAAALLALALAVPGGARSQDPAPGIVTEPGLGLEPQADAAEETPPAVPSPPDDRSFAPSAAPPEEARSRGARTPDPTPTPTPNATSTSTATPNATAIPNATSTSTAAPTSTLPPQLLPAPPLPKEPPPRPALRVAALPTASSMQLPPPRLTAPQRSAVARRGGFRLAIEEENDGISLGRPRTDEFFTQGLRVSARWPTGMGKDGEETQVGIALGQEIYTPHDLKSADLEVLRNDRPYAGWLYAALLLRSIGDAPGLRVGADAGGPGEAIFEVDVSVGVTGPQSEAGSIQTWFHGLMVDYAAMRRGARNPAGWTVYQTANQLTFDTAVRWRFDAVQAAASLGAFTRSTGSALSLRVTPRVRLDIGSTRDGAGLGLELRAGLLGSRARPRARVPFELWAFGGGDGRYVAYDGFIEGPLKNGVTTLVRPVPWVGTLQAGAGLRVGPLELAFRQLWETATITPLPAGARALHRSGRITVAFGAP